MSDMNDIYKTVDQLSDLNKKIYNILQDPIFDSLAFSKTERIKKKLHDSDFSKLKTIFLGDHLKNAKTTNCQREYINLSTDFLTSPPENIPENSIFLLTNNDIGSSLPKYIDFYNSNPDILFVIWDWDSQHWIMMSSILAVNSDFYLAAGSENAFYLSHFNPYIIGPVFCAVHQWTRRFIIDNMECIFGNRSNLPFGMHVYYDAYPKRNRAIASVSKYYPSVGFTNNQYKSKSELDNLKEWAGYKIHWISPVLSGVPIRVYNSLITGGIPLLPKFTKNIPEIEILGESPFYYGVEDLIYPQKIVEDAIAKFDLGGESGLIQRISNAIEKHHIDNRCETIFLAVEEQIRKILNYDKSFQPDYLGMR